MDQELTSHALDGQPADADVCSNERWANVK